MLRSADWYLVTDVSGQPIGVIFKGQEVQDEIQNFPIHITDTRGWSFFKHISCSGSRCIGKN